VVGVVGSDFRFSADALAATLPPGSPLSRRFLLVKRVLRSPRLRAARNDGDDQIFLDFVLGGLGVYWIFFLTTALLRSEPIFSY
jgi:hypothetical protein